MIEVQNKKVTDWVAECAAMTKPEEIVWIDGSEAQLEAIRALAVETGEMIRLNEEKLPGCYYYRTDPKDVARDEKRTVICTTEEKDAGPTNNWVQKDEMYAKMRKLFDGSMKGRTMYVIPYSMGVVGSKFSKIGIEITDSIYVVLSMNIMTRIGDPVIEELNKGADFVKCLHSKAQVNAENKYIAQFPEENTIWSINSAYGGNVLLGKKCFALRIGSVLGKREGWMAEHMLILCVEAPNGEKKYISAAFPSACGKTNLAMLIPPKHLQEKGYKVYTIGDDIAWLRIGDDGRLYAVNPENGFFGVAPGTNSKTNNNALMTTKKNTIYTNVARNLDDNTVWWEGLDQPAPANGLDWQARPWNGQEEQAKKAAGEDFVKGAHPNSRFTAPAENCPSIAPEFFTGEGVPISAIILGGRRANGAVGVVRYDPMAMLPFCGYHMGDYFQHWLDMGTKLTNPPKIFNVNWFRTDEEGNFIWPGFGDNLRALLWALDRCEDKVSASETPLGFVPRPEDLDLTGIDISEEALNELLTVDKETWKKELEGIKDWYAKFDHLPKELTDALAKLEEDLK